MFFTLYFSLIVCFTLVLGNSDLAFGCSSTNAYAERVPSRTLESAFYKYVSGCQCGYREANNCAHFVANALIKGGFSEIDGGTGANFRLRNTFIVCRAGRPVRAKELRDWAARTFTEYSKNNLPSDLRYCLVYQGGSSYAGGHVAIAKVMGGRKVANEGTGWYESWPEQRYFCQ